MRRKGGKPLEVDSFVDLTTYTIFTLMVVLGIPFMINLTFKGFLGLKKYGFKKLPKHFMDRKDATYALEAIGAGLFMIIGSIWYLFIDNGGNLFFWFKELKEFFHLDHTFNFNVESIVSVLVSLMILSAFLSIFLQKRYAKKVHNHYRLEYNIALKFFSSSMLFLGVIVNIFILQDVDNKLEIFLAIILFLSPSGSLFLEFIRVKIEFNDKNIYLFSPWRKNRVVRWKDIVEYQYRESMQLSIFKTKSQGNIYISTSISGLDDFFARASREQVIGLH